MSRFFQRSPALVLALTLVAGGLGCDAGAAVTEVVVVIDAEEEVRSRVAVLWVRVLDSEGSTVLDRTDSVGEEGGPTLPGARVPLTPRGGDAERRWTIVIEARAPSGCVLARVEESGGYEAGVSREEHVRLTRATGEECAVGPGCEACDDGLECTSARCVDGHCVHDVAAGSCVIDGACIGEGASPAEDPCRTCDPARASRGWSVAAACDWAQIETLGEGTVAGARYGGAVATDGVRVIVGAPHDGVATGDERAGTAFVFAREAGGRWSLEQELSAGVSGHPGDRFGAAVAIHGDWALVGAPDSVESGVDTGAVFVFERITSGWVARGRLAATRGALASNDDYGAALAMDGALAVVGIPRANTPGESGRAALFERQAAGRWTEIERLAAPTPQRQAYFGTSVAIDGDRVVVGAPRTTVDESATGAAYVFASRGEPGALLVPPPETAEPFVSFGASVATSGERVVVGATHTNAGGSDAGGAYVFDAAGDPLTLLLAAAPGAQLGVSVAASPRWTASGAPNDGPSGTGYAYVWEEIEGRPRLPRLASSPPAPGGRFGRALAMSDRWLVVGASYQSIEGEPRGAAFLFELRGP